MILVGLFVLLRRDDGDESAGGTTTATTTATTPTATAPTTTQSPPTAPSGPQRISVVVAGGTVAGGARTVPVEQNTELVLVVRADVTDEVHVHGYDVMQDVAPGAPARIALRATIPGRFDVELEDRKLRILELEVRP